MNSIVKYQAAIALLVTILSNFSDSDYCPASAPTVAVVSECPTNKTEWDQAASRKKCNLMSAKCGDKTPVYHCLLNQWRNETVEVCASTWYISGFCAVYNTNEMKVIDDFERDCTNFSEGKCSTRYISSEAYLYQKCYMQKSSNKIPLPDRSIRTEETEETNDCILSTIIAIVVTVLVLVIITLVVFITLRLKISKKASDEECMPFCNATKQKVGKKDEVIPLMNNENEDNTINKTKETANLVSFGDTAESKQMPDIQQKRVHIEKDGVDTTRPGDVNVLKAKFEEAKSRGPYFSERGIRKPNREATDPVVDKGNDVKKDDIQKTAHNTNNDVECTLHGNIVNEEGNNKEQAKSPGPYSVERGIKKTTREATDPVVAKGNAVEKDDIQKTAHNTNNDVESTLHGNIVNEEGNNKDPAADKENAIQKDHTKKVDHSTNNDIDCTLHGNIINEEGNDEDPIADKECAIQNEVEQKMDNTIKNDVDSSSHDSLINDKNNDEEKTQSPDSTPCESVTDTKNEKPTDSDAGTKKISQNEEIEKKADDSGDRGDSQGGFENAKKFFEEKLGKKPV